MLLSWGHQSRPNSCASLCRRCHALVSSLLCLSCIHRVLCLYTDCRISILNRAHVVVFLSLSHPCCSSSLQSSHSLMLLPWWCKSILLVYESMCVCVCTEHLRGPLPRLSLLLLHRGQLPGLHALPPAVQSKEMMLPSHWSVRTNCVPNIFSCLLVPL